MMIKSYLLIICMSSILAALEIALKGRKVRFLVHNNEVLVLQRSEFATQRTVLFTFAQF